MKRKNATILISICIVVNALNIALLAISIMDKDWILSAVGFIIFTCCTILTRELNKMKKEILISILFFVLGCLSVAALTGMIWTLCFLFLGLKSPITGFILSVILMVVYYRKFRNTKWGKILKL